jgi:cytochrome c-type biogenesis protein CcmH
VKLKGLSCIISALIFSFLFAAPAVAQDLSVDDVARQLICMCGCNSVLPDCVHLECGVRESMRGEIAAQLAAGKSKAEIVQFFVDRYGEVVLSAPPKKGFNLTAWLTPFLALAAGGGVVYLLLRNWVFQGKSPAVTPSPEHSAIDEEYHRRLEKELIEFREGR